MLLVCLIWGLLVCVGLCVSSVSKVLFFCCMVCDSFIVMNLMKVCMVGISLCCDGNIVCS